MDDIEALEKEIAEQEAREAKIKEEQKSIKECAHCKEQITDDFFECQVHGKKFCEGCFLGTKGIEKQYSEVAKCEPHAPVSIMGMVSSAVRKRKNCLFYKVRYLLKEQHE